MTAAFKLAMLAALITGAAMLVGCGGDPPSVSATPQQTKKSPTVPPGLDIPPDISTPPHQPAAGP